MHFPLSSYIVIISPPILKMHILTKMYRKGRQATHFTHRANKTNDFNLFSLSSYIVTYTFIIIVEAEVNNKGRYRKVLM